MLELGFLQALLCMKLEQRLSSRDCIAAAAFAAAFNPKLRFLQALPPLLKIVLRLVHGNVAAAFAAASKLKPRFLQALSRLGKSCQTSARNAVAASAAASKLNFCRHCRGLAAGICRRFAAAFNPKRFPRHCRCFKAQRRNSLNDKKVKARAQKVSFGINPG